MCNANPLILPQRERGTMKSSKSECGGIICPSDRDPVMTSAVTNGNYAMIDGLVPRALSTALTSVTLTPSRFNRFHLSTNARWCVSCRTSLSSSCAVTEGRWNVRRNWDPKASWQPVSGNDLTSARAKKGLLLGRYVVVAISCLCQG